MKKITALERSLLLITGLLAAYQIAVGIEGANALAIICYTIAFGVLMVAGLLLIIFGYDILESSLVVIAATIVPLSLSLGLVIEYLSAYREAYLWFVLLGLAAVVITRTLSSPMVATLVLAFAHGVSGLVIFGLPILLSLRGQASPGFALVGVGGGLIGIAGLLLSLLKTGKPILSKDTILKLFPGLLLLTTSAFVAGFALA
ncbi:MAG: hypothetical protein P8074_02650 [Anaerolineales bacterium]|jgi:hypothetical protein